MYRSFSISLVIPCHNEELGVKKIMTSAPGIFDEIIVVDNNSTDKTAEVARGLGARIIHEFANGYGSACLSGIKAAGSDLIGVIDGDGSYSPGEIQKLADALIEKGLNFVSGNRFPLSDPRAMTQASFIGNVYLTLLTNLLFKTSLSDSQSGMWVFKRTAFERMRLNSPGMSFSEEIKLEMIRINRGGFGEVPITYDKRVGTRKMSYLRDGFLNSFFLIKRAVGYEK